jgi:hypothetical protein
MHLKNSPHLQTYDHGKRDGAFVTAFHVIRKPCSAKMSKTTPGGNAKKILGTWYLLTVEHVLSKGIVKVMRRRLTDNRVNSTGSELEKFVSIFHLSSKKGGGAHKDCKVRQCSVLRSSQYDVSNRRCRYCITNYSVPLKAPLMHSPIAKKTLNVIWLQMSAWQDLQGADIHVEIATVPPSIREKSDPTGQYTCPRVNWYG